MTPTVGTVAWCDVGRGRLAFEVVGPADGPPVLLVAGGGGALWGWARLAPQFGGPGAERLMPLGDALAGCRVAAFDQAGLGRSLDVSPPLTAADYAADAACVGRSALGEAFVVVGLSLGGAAALQLALAEPTLVSGLVLACTFAGVSSFVDHDLGPLPPFDPADGELDSDLWDEAAKTVGSFAAEFPPREPKLFAEIVRRSAATPCAAGLGDSQIAQFVSHDAGDRLTELETPAFVVCGDQDRTMPLGNSRLLADGIADASLTVVEGAGHALHLEAPAALAHAIGRAARR